MKNSPAMYQKIVKRLIDIFLAGVGLLLISPFFLCLLIILLIYNRGTPFFYQPRPGKDGNIFYVIKLKTMTDKRGPDGELLSNNQRITPFGLFLRKTSLDEIPQLWNILKGEMSLIGPRPLRIDYLPLYSDQQHRRHEVRPGITGWAQVKGRNTISWTQKFEYDVWYVDNLSFPLDLKILFLTIRKVLMREDINSSKETVGSEKFNGNN